MPSKNLYLQHFKNVPSSKTLGRFYKSCNKAAQRLRQEIADKTLPMIDVIFEKNDIKDFENVAQSMSKFKKVIVLGVGGSSLGGKTIASLKDQDHLEFFESIDATTIANSLQKINYKNTFFLVISKSGETIETICQTLIIIEELKKAKIKNFAKQFLFVTQSHDNSIAKIAQEIGATIAHHPQEIGGRYSCFSIVGMLPAILCGLDAKKIRNGAKKVVDEFVKGNSQLVDSCAIQLYFYDKGRSNSVIMPYIDNLKNFTDWYRQLWAESLGKSGFGSTPINSMGTVDQHSQLQLYLEGPQDKFFTFLTQNKTQNNFLLKDLKDCPTLFGGKKLSDVVTIEQETTIEILSKKKRPIRILEINKLNEETLGALMMQMFLETILVAYVKDINPFDQPAVELRKNMAKKLLGQ